MALLCIRSLIFLAGEWGAWSSCSATCGTGRSTRHRTCAENGLCEAVRTQERSCNTFLCTTIGKIIQLYFIMNVSRQLKSFTQSRIWLRSCPSDPQFRNLKANEYLFAQLWIFFLLKLHSAKIFLIFVSEYICLSFMSLTVFRLSYYR